MIYPTTPVIIMETISATMPIVLVLTFSGSWPWEKFGTIVPKNPFENEENTIKETVDFIMSARGENDDTEEGWTEGAGRIGFAQMFLEDFAASQETKEKILEKVRGLVANEQQENKQRARIEATKLTGTEGDPSHGDRKRADGEYLSGI